MVGILAMAYQVVVVPDPWDSSTVGGWRVSLDGGSSRSQRFY